MPEIKSTFDIIAAAAEGAEADGIEGDETDFPSDETEGDEPEVESRNPPEEDEESSGDKSSDEGDEPPAEELSDEDKEKVQEAVDTAQSVDELDKLLDELGFKLPKQGQKENRPPVARVRARMKQGLQKYGKTFEGKITDLTTQLEQASTSVETMRRIDAMLAETNTNPDRAREYIERLAVLHPAFRPFLGIGKPTDAKVEPSEAIKNLGPMPAPDLKYDDGSRGYSDEQFAKRDEWLMAKASITAREEALAEMDKRIKPIVDKTTKEERDREDARKANEVVLHYRNTYGKYFTDQEAMETKQAGSSDISKWRAKNPGKTFRDAVEAVLVPKMVADRTTIRKEVISDAKAKRRTVSRVVAQPTRGKVSRPSGPRSTADIIAAAANRLGDDSADYDDEE